MSACLFNREPTGSASGDVYPALPVGSRLNEDTINRRFHVISVAS